MNVIKPIQIPSLTLVAKQEFVIKLISKWWKMQRQGLNMQYLIKNTLTQFNSSLCLSIKLELWSCLHDMNANHKKNQQQNRKVTKTKI